MIAQWPDGKQWNIPDTRSGDLIVESLAATGGKKKDNKAIVKEGHNKKGERVWISWVTHKTRGRWLCIWRYDQIEKKQVQVAQLVGFNDETLALKFVEEQFGIFCLGKTTKEDIENQKRIHLEHNGKEKKCTMKRPAAAPKKD